MTSEPTNPKDPGDSRIELDATAPKGPNSQEVADQLRPRAGTYGSYGAVGSWAWSDETHLLDYLRVLYKRRWPALAAFVLVLGTVGVYTLTAIPIFDARAQLLIENETDNIVSFQEVVRQSTAPDYYQTQYLILGSRALALRALETADLKSHPAFAAAPGAAAGGFSIRRALGAAADTVRDLFRLRTQSVDLAVGETAEQSRLIDSFLEGLTISPVRNSRLVDVIYSSPNPKLAAVAANAVAKAYVEQDLALKFQAAKEATDFLYRQLAEQRKAVEAGELALQQYREKDDAVSLEDRQNIVVLRLTDLNAAVTKARTERIQKEAAYNQIRAIQNNRALVDTFPAVLSNGFIQQLKAEEAALQRRQAELADKLGERHPEMIKIRTAIQTAGQKLQSEIAKIVQSIRSEYLAAAEQERSLIAALEQQKAEALSLNRRAIKYGVLQRDAVTNRQLYDGLLQRAKETGIAGELRASNISIVDPAEVPRFQARPSRMRSMLIGLFGATFVAIGLAFFFEYVDTRIKSPEELETHLGLSFLGMIPELPEVADAQGIDGVTSSFSEAVRFVRANLLFSATDGGGRSVVISSTIPSEGKTLVTANLGSSMARAGQRVLLIDADMRRGRLHQLFDREREPGLSNVMVGNSKVSEAVVRTSVSNLWILPGGTIPPNPSELLASRRFKEFLHSLKDHFEWIILDTPPAMAVADAATVAHEAGGVVFVVGADMTSRHVARRAIAELQLANVKLIGGILNRVDLQHNAYYYAQYYGREYAAYHTSANVS